MANAIYPLYKQALLAGTVGYDIDNNSTVSGPFCALLAAGYTYSTAHDFADDLGANIVSLLNISTPTVTTGTFDGADLTYTAVSGTIVTQFACWRNNAGASSTWPLFLFEDTSVTGLPVTPNGGNITVTWNASGIFLISDARVKTDIKEVAKVGPLTLYEYRYNWGTVRKTGFLAQDVEKILPEAVKEIAGLKYVNHDYIMEKFSGPVAQP